MTLQRFGRAIVVVAALAIASSSSAQPNLRSMYVSVLNDQGAPVPNLGPSDFVVREDNIAREVLRVAPATEPMQIAVLVDNSTAAQHYIADMRKALHEFVTAVTSGELGGRNEMALIGLADRPTILGEYTTSAAALHKAVDRLFAQPQSGMQLLQALIDMSRGFKAKEATRPVIISITTEGTEFSDRSHDQVLGPLRESGAAYHALVIGPLTSRVDTNARERGIVMDEGTRDTGGRRDNLLTSMALSQRLKELAAELTHQYRVTYARPESLIPPERITVAAARPGLTARGTPIKEPRTQGKP